MEIIKYSITVISKYKFQLLFYILTSLLISIIGFVLPLIIGEFLDNLIANPVLETITNFVMIFTLLNLLTFVLNFITSIIGVSLQLKSSTDMNRKILDHVKKLPKNYFDNNDKAYLNQRISLDSTSIVSFTISTINDTIINIFTIISSLVLLFRINYQMCYLLVLLFILYYLLYRLSKKRIYNVNMKSKESANRFFSSLQEQLERINLIKNYNLFNFFDNRLMNSFKDYHNSVINTQKVSYFFAGSETIITTFTRATFYLLGGLQFLNGKITIGLFSILASYFTSALNSLKFFINLSQKYLDSKISYDRIKELLDIDGEDNGSLVLENIESVAISKLNFSYGKNEIFKNFSCKFEKGNIYLIKGQNGVGKSTLIDILMGYCNDDIKENLKINNVSATDIDFYKTRENAVSFIAQKPMFFNDKVYKNIYLECGEQKDSDDVLISEFELFKNNEQSISLNTVINENGNNLSGGELQKISILRELIRNKSLFILDEPSTYLDKKAKKTLCEHLKRNKNNCITVIISHADDFDDIGDSIINIERQGC